MNIMKSKKNSKFIYMVMILGLILSVMPLGMVGFAAGDIVVRHYEVDKEEINYKDEFNLKVLFFKPGIATDVTASLSGDNFISKEGKLLFTQGELAGGIDVQYMGGSKTVSLEISYKGEQGVQSSQSLTVPVLEVNQMSASETKAKFTPKLQIDSSGDVPTILAGVDDGFKLNIKNTTDHVVKNLIVSLEQSGGEFPFITQNVTNSVDVDVIGSQFTKGVVFPVDVAAGAKPKTYPIKVNYNFENKYGDTFETSEVFYVKISNNAKEPIIGIVDQTYTGESVVGGGTDKITLKFKNTGQVDAEAIKIELSGFKADEIRLNNDLDTKLISRINKNETATVEFDIITGDKIKTGIYTLSAKVTYYHENGSPDPKDISVFIPVDGVEDNLESIVVENIRVPKAIAAGDQGTIKATIKNTGNKEEKNIKVALSSDASLIYKTSAIKKIKSIKPGEAVDVSYAIITKAEEETNSYPTYLKLTKIDGEESDSITEYMGIYIEGVKEMSKPKIIIDNYDVGGDNVLAGKEFDLTITLLNTSGSMGIQNAKVTLSSDDGVFTPVDTASSFFIPTIAPNQTASHTIKLKAKNDAQVKMYNVTAEIEYEDAKGNSYDAQKNPYKATEKMGVNVKQEIRLEVGEIFLPFEAVAGNPINIEAEFFNMGKSDMKNLMVKVEGNFMVQDSNYFVGDFNPGRSEYFSSTIIPQEVGEGLGKVLFEFEDLGGERHTVEKELKFTVIEGQGPGVNEGGEGIDFPMNPEGEAVEFEIDPETGMPKIDPETGMPIIKKPGSGNNIYYIVAGVLAVPAIIGFILRRRKKKRLLMEAEDEE